MPSGFKVRIYARRVGSEVFIQSGLGSARLTIGAPICIQYCAGKLRWDPVVPGLHGRLSGLISRLGAFSVCSFKLVGRGYRVTALRSTRCVVLEIGLSNRAVVSLPSSVNLCITTRYEFELYSLDPAILAETSLRIRQLRPPNTYTSSGIFLNGEAPKRKQGKSSQY